MPSIWDLFKDSGRYVSGRHYAVSEETLTLLDFQATEVAVGFWQLLLPLGLAGGALRPVGSPPGWKEEYTQWWFQFIEQRAVKGISKDTWNMVGCRNGGINHALTLLQFLDFVSTSEEKFGNHDTEGWTDISLADARRCLILVPGSWPSLIDDFVAFAQARIVKAS